MEKVKVTANTQTGVTIVGSMVCTENQYKKLTDPIFADRIHAYEKDMHFEHFAEMLGNIPTSNIRRCLQQADSEIFHQLEIDHINFMSFVDGLEYSRPDTTDQKKPEFDEDIIDAVRELLDDPESDVITDSFIPVLACGNQYVATPMLRIPHNVVQEMCHLFIEKYG